MMYVLVVTGGIGSGKSEVCRILRGIGITKQYNADERVKRLYREHPSLLAEIEAALNLDLRDEEGNFRSGKLAEIIFSDPASLDMVEKLVFPALIADFEAFKSANMDEEIIVFESATILEKPYFDGFGDKTVFVAAPYSTRLERACMRDGARPEAVRARMNQQKLMNLISEGRPDPRIDAIIVNDGDFDELKTKTYKIISDILIM